MLESQRMEQLDILDLAGNKTGEITSKDEAHAKGLWHRAIHVWFVDSKNQLLLQHRSPQKNSHPNKWDISVAGHISAGEDSITSAIRETEEEIGLTLKAEDFKLIGTIVQQSIQNNGTYINNEFDDVYLVKRDIDISTLKMQPEEVDDLRFISKEELQSWITEGKADLVRHDKEYELLFKNI